MGGLENCDPVLLDLFRAEMDTHLPALSQGLLALEKNKAGPKDLEAMMRAAHSIKGAARIVGVDAAVRVAHSMEDCFSAAQGQRISLGSDAVDVLLRGLDALQLICSPQSDSAMTDASLTALLDQIAAVKDGKLDFESRHSMQSEAPPQADKHYEVSVLPPIGKSDTGLVDGDTLRSPETTDRHLRLPVFFDNGAANSMRTEFCNILAQSPSRLRMDFSAVRHVSAAALSLLASFARELAEGPSVTAVHAEGVSAPMAVLLRTTGLDRMFQTVG